MTTRVLAIGGPPHYRHRKTNQDPVPYADAVARVRAGMQGRRLVFNISQFADLIWPGHRMTRQGAALAVGRLVHRMNADGVLQQTISGGRMAWQITRRP